MASVQTAYFTSLPKARVHKDTPVCIYVQILQVNLCGTYSLSW